MMIVAGLAVAFNAILGLLLHGVCHIPHSHSHHHSHLPESHSDNDESDDELESQVRSAIPRVLWKSYKIRRYQTFLGVLKFSGSNLQWNLDIVDHEIVEFLAFVAKKCSRF